MYITEVDKGTVKVRTPRHENDNLVKSKHNVIYNMHNPSMYNN